VRTHAFHQKNQRKLIDSRSLPVLKDFVTGGKYEAIQSAYDQNFLGTSVSAWSCIRNIARYMGVYGARKEEESEQKGTAKRTTGCVGAKREKEKEREREREFPCPPLSIRPITFAFRADLRIIAPV